MTLRKTTLFGCMGVCMLTMCRYFLYVINHLKVKAKKQLVIKKITSELRTNCYFCIAVSSLIRDSTKFDI